MHTGDATCDDAHAALLIALKQLNVNFVDPASPISVVQKGNLGEFISLQIARSKQFSQCQVFAQNAINPLNTISISGIDLAYAHFDLLDENNDRLYIQEVKTTGASNLSYFDSLVKDAEKLFSINLDLTLQSRIQAFANSLEIERGMPDLADRVLKLGGVTPQSCSKVRLVPTGIHDLIAGNPVPKLLAVRSAIAAFGWNPVNLHPWAVGISDLDDRLLRLARGQT